MTSNDLTSLLGGRCYHGFDTLFGSQEDVDFWVRVARDEAEDEEVREFFCARGITAAADFPAALYYRKLVKVGQRRIRRRKKPLLALKGRKTFMFAWNVWKLVSPSF